VVNKDLQVQPHRRGRSKILDVPAGPAQRQWWQGQRQWWPVFDGGSQQQSTSSSTT